MIKAQLVLAARWCQNVRSWYWIIVKYVFLPVIWQFVAHGSKLMLFFIGDWICNEVRNNLIGNQALLRQQKPLPRHLISIKNDPAFESWFTDLDPDVCQIAPKMFWIHYLVGVSHFAECRENRPVTVWEMLINLLKSTILLHWGKWKSDPAPHQQLISSSDW